MSQSFEKSQNALARIWGESMAKAAVDYSRVISPEPQTDLILACGVGLLGQYIEKLEKRIEDLECLTGKTKN